MTTKQDIIDYVMHTPANTNRAVLETLLDDLSNTGDSPVFVLDLTENWNDRQFESTKTWGELHDAILAKKIITLVAVNASTDENVQLSYLFFTDQGISTNIETDNKWVIDGTFTFDNTFYPIIGYEDNANVPIVIPFEEG